MQPWLSIIVPTIGRSTLTRMVASITDPSVEIVVVADTYHGDVDEDLARARNAVRGRVRWFDHDAGYHAWGQPQRQFGMTQARGHWLMFSQDDNVLLPDALSHIAQTIRAQPHPRPLLFQVDNWQAGVVWKVPAIVQGNVDADCIVTPNVASGLGRWGDRNEGDYDFILATSRLWPDGAFIRHVIARSPERDPLTRHAMSAAWTRPGAVVS